MIKVLIVDDSAVVRKILTDELSKYVDIDVVGTAVDPYAARDKIVRLEPDVITLDLEMPRMDGLSFLAKLMRHYPKPVVVVSSLTPKNSEMAIKALELGAVEVICKPGPAYSTPDIARQLVGAIRAAASARVKERDESADSETQSMEEIGIETSHKIVAIGASTGGTRAVEDILRVMPANSPGIMIVQHMPENFTRAFADRLNQICKMEVKEAADNDRVVPGVALVAPGGKHMLLKRSGALYIARLKDGPPVHHQRPSVDVLFESVAAGAGANAVGVLLTGMGCDGARGLLAMRQKGAHTMAQDEATSVVFGMPGEAVKLGAAIEVRPLPAIPKAILDAVERQQVHSK
ncbi:MAG TPA: chemotaxis response regulator protein-glutamate methylesterase [bacterium]|nr:chemotaxis response regulator protein-glutamate methylesterase [bacterium]